MLDYKQQWSRLSLSLSPSLSACVCVSVCVCVYVQYMCMYMYMCTCYRVYIFEHVRVLSDPQPEAFQRDLPFGQTAPVQAHATHLVVFGTVAEDQAHVGHKLAGAVVVLRVLQLQLLLHRVQGHWLLNDLIVVGDLGKHPY